MLLGLNDHPLDLADGSEAAFYPSVIAASGAQIVRFPVQWSTLNTASGVYSSGYMTSITNTVTSITGDGMVALIEFGGSPTWLAGVPSSVAYPTDPTNFAAFVAAYAAACSYLVTQLLLNFTTAEFRIEIWDEPDANADYVPDGVPVGSNIGPTLGAAYAPLAIAAKEAMLAVNDNLVILSGAMGAVPLWTMATPCPFLTTCYSLGMTGPISGHIYAQSKTGDSLVAVPDPTTYFVGILSQVRAIQIANGDLTPFWVTECGYFPAIPDFYGVFPPNTATTGILTASNQAAMLANLIAGLSNLVDTENILYIAALVYYEFMDSASTTTSTTSLNIVTSCPSTFTLASTAGFASGGGDFGVVVSGGVAEISYTAVSGLTLTGCAYVTGAQGTLSTGAAVTNLTDSYLGFEGILGNIGASPSIVPGSPTFKPAFAAFQAAAARLTTGHNRFYSQSGASSGAYPRLRVPQS